MTCPSVYKRCNSACVGRNAAPIKFKRSGAGKLGSSHYHLCHGSPSQATGFTEFSQGIIEYCTNLIGSRREKFFRKTIFFSNPHCVGRSCDIYYSVSVSLPAKTSKLFYTVRTLNPHCPSKQIIATMTPSPTPRSDLIVSLLTQEVMSVLTPIAERVQRLKELSAHI